MNLFVIILDLNRLHIKSIHHEDSRSVPMLQVADYIASATQRFLVHRDTTFYDAYSNKLKYREKWDWNDKIIW